MSDLKVNFKIDNPSFAAALKKLEMMPKEVSAALEKEVLKQVMAVVLAEAQRRAPVGTKRKPGSKRIKSSLKVKISKGRDYKLYGEVIAGAPHAYLVEFGHKIKRGKRPTSRLGRALDTRTTIGTVPPHPFLRPAWLQHEQKILGLTEAIINNVIERNASKK
jgi:HK97 gp10 family phage protein